jgi:hypothetical protein
MMKKRDLVQFAAHGRRWGAAAVAAGMLGIAGCATAPAGGSLSSEMPAEAKAAAVAERAVARWEALIKGDSKTAYTYLSPASREVVPLERFERKMNVNSFRGIKLDQASCEAETCKVRLWLTFDHRMMQGVTTPIEETWVISNGQAWLVYRE